MKNKILISLGSVGSYLGVASFAHAGTLASTTEAAGTAFETTTGFTFASVVSFAVGLLMQALGLGLYVLEQTWPVLLAIAAIGAVIGLIYLGWRFMHRG